MAGLQNKGFETKVKHFAQPWKYAEREVVSQCEFQRWVEGGQSLEPPE
jgi:hypothetical protein